MEVDYSDTEDITEQDHGQRLDISNSKSKLATVLEALKEVIVSQHSTQREPSHTEYFAIIASTLNSNTETEHLAELLQILESVTERSSKVIVQLQFKPLSTCLLQIANSCSENQSRILTNCIRALGKLSIMQECSEAVWSSRHGLQVTNAFLSLIDDNRPKLRKLVHDTLRFLLQHHKLNKFNGLRLYVADFCIAVLTSCTRSDYKRSLQVVFFLESSLSLLPDTKLGAIFNVACKLQNCEQPMLVAAVYRMFDGFFQSNLNVKVAFLVTCVQILLNHKPITADMESNSYFCTACGSAMVAIYKLSIQEFENFILRSIVLLISECESEFSQVHCAVAASMKRLIIQCFENLPQKLIEESIKSIQQILQLRLQHTWIYTLDVIRVLFDTFLGKDRSKYIIEAMIKTADLYHAIESKSIVVQPELHRLIGDALGRALRSCGVEQFLENVSFVSTKVNYSSVDENREWVLRILAANVRYIPCYLSDYGKLILPVARKCNQLMQKYESEGKEHNALIEKTRTIQLWSLFPEFCYFGPLDIVTSFPLMPTVLQSCLDDPSLPELKEPIILGLQYIAKSALTRNNVAEKEVLQKYATSLLTSLLKILEFTSVSSSLFTLGVNCIGVWISIVSKKTVDSITKKLLQLLLHATSSDSMNIDMTDNLSQATAGAAGWMLILQAIIPHLSDAMVELLYRSIRPLMIVNNSNDSITMQKRAYHILSGILYTHSDKLFLFEKPQDILLFIKESLLTCHVSSRSIRLKCIEYLIDKIPEEEKGTMIKDLFGEILICLKDANKKTRDSAMDLLKLMMQVTTSAEVFTMLCAGLAGESSSMRSSAIISLCMLLLDRRNDEEIVVLHCDIIPMMVMLLEQNHKCAELTRAILSFVRVSCATLPEEHLLNSLPSLIFCFTEGLGDEKNKYVSRSRAIMRKLVRRVEESSLRDALPESEIHLLNYVLRMNRRANRRKEIEKKDRLQRMLGSDSEDSDDEDDDDDVTENKEVDYRMTSRPKAIRSDEIMNTFASSLDELLEDNIKGSSFEILTNREQLSSKSKLSKVANAEKDDEADEKYIITFAADGQLVIKENDSSNNLRETDENVDVLKAKRGDVNSKPEEKLQKRAREPGEEYRSKRGSGDVWRSGMLQPHAFIPLDPKMMTKRHKRDALSTYTSVVGGNKHPLKTSKTLKGRAVGAQGNRKQRAAVRSHAKIAHRKNSK